MKKNILLCTLGASWAVIPEVYGFLDPEKLPLYRHHPKAAELDQIRREYGLQAPDEIWICTTQGEQTQKSLIPLREWQHCLPRPIDMRIWQAQDSDQLANQEECAHMRELILRACLKAHDYAQGGQVALSLAGGRKTMSADVQWAGSLFGCSALLHVVGQEPLPDTLKNAQPQLFAQPLPYEICAAIMPLVTGQPTRSELLDVSMEECGPIDSGVFPLPLADVHEIYAWSAPETFLETELKRREKAGSQLLGNYLAQISQSDHHENWRSLYRLPPRVIDALRVAKLGPCHKNWLQAIPKADLHRHIGGCLDIPAQRQVGMAIWQSLSAKQRRDAQTHVADLLRKGEWDWDWPAMLTQSGERAHNAAALLVEASDEQLNASLYGKTEPRVALKSRHQHKFQAYERPGELTGSAVLRHPAAIETYARHLILQAHAEGLAYVELRGSPQKYGEGLDFLRQFYAALSAAAASLPPAFAPQFRFIIIADRRKENDLEKTIKMAVAAKQEMPDFIAGLDLAGDESIKRPQDIAKFFLPAFEECLPLTIHAGEGEAAEFIWQAAYHLHADRIGHGLTISDHAQLAERFRNRDICLELCPSSNREVVGFYDPAFPDSAGCETYPLQKLWAMGLPLTLCTDNPGISRTTIAGEYLAAARMMGGTLTCWDALAMIKQGLVHAFLPGKDKERLIKQADKEIYRIISEGWPYHVFLASG